jgi:hypothetical protein
MTTPKPHSNVDALLARLAALAVVPEYFAKLSRFADELASAQRQKEAADAITLLAMGPAVNDDPRIEQLLKLAVTGRLHIPRTEPVPRELDQLCYLGFAESEFGPDFSMRVEITDAGEFVAKLEKAKREGRFPAKQAN